ncbi:MAG: GNAT family N-acetyltransferase [Anaerolineales bacterium]|nr:GNAT family N-acetyltransferase [Anaerolineales bacterium]
MINLDISVRRATAQDHRQLSNLIFQESNTHRHLDWRSTLEWIGARYFWVLVENGNISAALACPDDPPNVAWIRLFTHQPHLSGPEAWSALWSIAQADISQSNLQAQVAAIVMKQWFQQILLSHGFELRQSIVLLELKSGNYHAPAKSGRIKIRPMQPADLPMVEEVDREAFGPFWHNTLISLQRAYSQAVYASVAEDGFDVIGYQLSTGNPFGAHLARLGVRPEAQGRGVGAALVHDLIAREGIFSAGKVSVNTQADNAASLNLYRKLGFVPTGEHYPVLVWPGWKGL